MPKLSTIPRPYEYDVPIPPFKGTPEPSKNIHPLLRNIYFGIESLLRTKTANETYKRGGVQALRDLFKSRGLLHEEPLTESHHRLLRPIEQRKIDKMDASLGYIDGTRKIRDLGVFAKLPANTPIPIEGGYWESGSSGEEQCLHLLRNPPPGYLYLEIDVSNGSTEIFDSEPLRALLNERHEQYKKAPQDKRLRLMKTPFAHISKWFDYFKCYDLYRIQGLLPEKLARYVYKNSPDRVKAMKKARQALKRAEQAIEAAEANDWPPVHID